MANEAVRESNYAKAVKSIVRNMIDYGIIATTKELVARETGLSLSSIVRYFPQKDDMVKAAIKDIDRIQMIDFSRVSGTGAERFHKLCEIAIRRTVETPRFFVFRSEIISYSFYAKNRELSEMLVEMGYHKQYEIAFRRGLEDGTLKLPFDAKMSAVYYSNLLFGYMSSVAMRRDLDDPDERKKAIFILHYLCKKIEDEIVVKPAPTTEPAPTPVE